MPVNTSSWFADPGAIASQEDSPLYSMIPAEVRGMIFELVLQPEVLPTAFSGHDFGVRSNHDLQPGDDSDLQDAPDSLSRWVSDGSETHSERIFETWVTWQCIHASNEWVRHDITGPWKPMPPLLAICRRIYLEITSSESATIKSLWRRPYRSFFLHGGPRRLRNNLSNTGNAPPGPGPAPIVQSRPMAAHLYTQMFWLSQKFFHHVRGKILLSCVRDLHISITRGDWWWNEQHHPLHINPFRSSSEGMSDLIAEAEVPGQQSSATSPPSLDWVAGHPGFEPKAWGLAFRGIPSLETLAMTFETSEYQRHELSRIVEWAAGWRFPLQSSSRRHPFRYLDAEGRKVERYSWRGLNNQIAMICCRCKSSTQEADLVKMDVDDSAEKTCGECVRLAKLAKRGYGPRLYCWKVKWTAKASEKLKFDKKPGRDGEERTMKWFQLVK